MLRAIPSLRLVLMLLLANRSTCLIPGPWCYVGLTSSAPHGCGFRCDDALPNPKPHVAKNERDRFAPKTITANKIGIISSSDFCDDVDTTAAATTTIIRGGDDAFTTCRRHWLRTTAISMVSVCSSGLVDAPFLPKESFNVASAVDELPSVLRDYTKLAPLGPAGTNNPKATSTTTTTKTIGLDPDEMARRLSHDLLVGATNKGGYFVSGDLSPDLFRDDCVFEDPTNRVNSLSQYQKALAILFDPNRSVVELLGDGLVVSTTDKEPTTISGRLRSRGYLSEFFPWNPYITAYETTVRYTLDPATGLVARQDQTWTKGASEALRQTFTPSFNDPPPRSTRTIQSTNREPTAVTALFEAVNGRRPYEYSAEERAEIDARIESIVQLEAASTPVTGSAVSSSAPGGGIADASLEGTWVVAYLQKGPSGAGIDRRIPFVPDWNYNDSFQVFASSDAADGARVTNIGQVLGPLVDIRVSGSLREITTTGNRRRFEASIDGGNLCFGGSLPSGSSAVSGSCPVALPMIRGRGIFESLYLGDRIRIGQNINGGGARVVQVRL
ncbi:unnamed protein product [Pseudo-nitzschia multistriata]|uniref:Plastid lipid-associated protein/fibrillin conserved domain-containing protein n=1 Tax=Pseudo-nitzschia multistriata TaxID=183589 RepID=A0A448ZCH6_9STRA|nr:unnamed protein product [Pseudo-nitzschia multistriata]